MSLPLSLTRPLGWTLTLALALTLTLSAQADTPPSVWDRARDPATADTYRLHVAVQRRLATGALAGEFGFTDSGESERLRVREMLERANAANSPDVRLRFDLGLVYCQLGRTESADYYKRAADVLKAAIEMAPDHPGVEDAWGNLTDACGHIGDHDCERRSYRAVLRLRTDEDEHGTSTLNLAETEMHLGNLREAVEGYREALRLAGRYPSRTLAPLAIWGLAIAFDRSGDVVAADREALRVLEMQTSSGLTGLLRSNGVFFFPTYEIHWYDAIGSAAKARRPTASAADAAKDWKAAEDAYGQYVRKATEQGSADRWLALAKVRLATAKAERERAEKKRGKVVVPPPPPDDEERNL